MRHPHGLRAAAGNIGGLPAIGDAFEGGFFAGAISHTDDGVATHLLIVAPRATGASGSPYDISTTRVFQGNSTLISGINSEFDGVANTAGILATNNIANFPAANFCVNLSINGYSDWYLPARYELDIAYENLKPTTFDNVTNRGINPYSVPERTVNRTASVPTQTSVAAFQAALQTSTRGPEAWGIVPFETPTSRHWSSTQINATSAWAQAFQNGETGNFGEQKSASINVRAFRRITL